LIEFSYGMNGREESEIEH